MSNKRNLRTLSHRSVSQMKREVIKCLYQGMKLAGVMLKKIKKLDPKSSSKTCETFHLISLKRHW